MSVLPKHKTRSSGSFVDHIRKGIENDLFTKLFIRNQIIGLFHAGYNYLPRRRTIAELLISPQSPCFPLILGFTVHPPGFASVQTQGLVIYPDNLTSSFHFNFLLLPCNFPVLSSSYAHTLKSNVNCTFHTTGKSLIQEKHSFALAKSHFSFWHYLHRWHLSEKCYPSPRSTSYQFIMNALWCISHSF